MFSDGGAERWVPRGVRLLDVAPELAEELTGEELAQARDHAILPRLALEPGTLHIDDLACGSVQGTPVGFLVLDGAIALAVELAGRVCTRLVTTSDLVLLDDDTVDSIPARRGWRALAPTQLAIFDDRLAVIAKRWPHLMIAILKRGAQQLRHGLCQQAISQLPRTEDRLLALFWSIADRRGTVGPDGVRIQLAVTHETLAQMVGARRSTVTLSLRLLADRGLVRPDAGGGWLLNPDSIDVLDPQDQPAAA